MGAAGDPPARVEAPVATPATNPCAASAPGDAPEPRRLWLIRHGETEWARALRHTSHTDVPLTEVGEAQARTLRDRLGGHAFALVLTSPSSRAAETARLAGFGEVAVVDPDLREWDYGSLEGLRTADIRQAYPGWTIWHGPWPGGEHARQVATRVDRVIARALAAPGDADVLLFAHGHLLRVLGARWLGLPASSGSLFALGTASRSILGWDKDTPVIELWNETDRD